MMCYFLNMLFCFIISNFLVIYWFFCIDVIELREIWRGLVKFCNLWIYIENVFVWILFFFYDNNGKYRINVYGYIKG